MSKDYTPPIMEVENPYGFVVDYFAELKVRLYHVENMLYALACMELDPSAQLHNNAEKYHLACEALKTYLDHGDKV